MDWNIDLSDPWKIKIDPAKVGSTMDTFGVDVGGGKKDVTPARQVLHEALVQLASERQISSFQGKEHDDKIEAFFREKLSEHPQFQKLQSEGNPDRTQISAILDDLNVPRLNLVPKAEPRGIFQPV